MTKTELHELEQKRQDRIPNRGGDNEGEVSLERIVGDRLPIVSIDGCMAGIFAEASGKIARGQSTLDGLLTPFEVMTRRLGKVEIRLATKFYWEEKETHIKVSHVRVDEDGRLLIRFRETTACYPRAEWVFTTENIARMIEGEQLRTAEEIDERAREALQGYPVEQ